MSMKNIKRYISCFMAVVLLVFTLPLEKAAFKAAEPEEGISYREYERDAEGNEKWSEKICSDYQLLTNSDRTLNEGWYVVDGTVTCSNLLTVNGDVHLILRDGSFLEAAKGIRVAEGNSFTIYAQSEGENMGVLTAKGDSSNAAGIGGYNSKESNGSITIHGGNITATGNSYGAGIGGGYNGEGHNITINGGIVTATGGTYGAGIGGGDEGIGRDIVINGGHVIANGKNNNAGIGGGIRAEGTKITINNGIVDAKGAAGIGGGDYAKGSYITINNGTINAEGVYASGSGIGGGSRNDGTHIYINGGTVKAVGKGAGIGGGGFASYSGNGTDIHIKNAVVEASGEYGAGIGGAGYTGNGTNISITNSKVIAITDSGAGIGGGGYGGSGTNISITNSYIIANGSGEAAGIGGGKSSSGENISIENSIVRATSASKKPFIGGGSNGQSINITKENSIIFDSITENVYTGTVYGNATLPKTLLGEPVELEIGANETLTAPENTSINLLGTLTNQGTFTIYNESCLKSDPEGKGALSGNGEFILKYASFTITADDIIVPEGMIYTGQDQTDYADNMINIDVSKYNIKTIYNTEFTVQNVLLDKWKKSIISEEVKKAGDYLAVYTNIEDNTSVSKKFTVSKAASTYNDSEQNTTLKSYEGNEEKSKFTYGSTITIKVTQRPDDIAALNLSNEFQEDTALEPSEGEITVFMKEDNTEVPLTEAKTAAAGSEVSFDIDTLQQGLTPGTYTLSVRYKGNENMADYSEDIIVVVEYHQALNAALLDTNKGENGWYVGPVTVEAPQGYLISSGNTTQAEWSSSIAAEALSLDEDGNYIYYLKEADTGYLTDFMTLEAAKIDATKPEFGDFVYTEGKEGTGIFVKIWNWLVGKDYITVTVPITEAESGLTEENIRLRLTNSEETDTESAVPAEVKLVGNTKEGYVLSFIIPAAFDGYYLITVKDTAGNESSLHKQRTVIDVTEPEISIKLKDIPYDETENIFENSISLNISVNDSPNQEISAGLKTAAYSFDGKASVSLTPEGGFDGTEDFSPILTADIEDIIINEKGSHTLLVYAEDHAGNKTEKEIAFQIYSSTTLSLSEKEGESGICEVIYDGKTIEAGTDFLVTQDGSEKEIIYSYQRLDSEDNSYKAGLPTESGSYKIKAEILQDDENFSLGAKAELELVIKKAKVESISDTLQVVKQKKHEISYDVSALLPKEVQGTTIYSIVNINNEDGILSADTMPSVGVLDTTILSLNTEAAETAGKQALITISFTNANYEISDAVLLIETTDKIPVKISGVSILEMEESQLIYSGNKAVWSGEPRAETKDGQIVDLKDSDYQYCWYELIEGKYTEIQDNLAPVSVGSYKLVVKAENNEYLGTQEILFEIVKREICDAVITLGEGLIFNGDVQTQTVVDVKAGGLLLTNEEYTITQNTGCQAGSYTLKITGTGNFTGTAEKEFVIAPLPVKLLWNVQSFIYDGNAHSVSASVSNAVNGYEVSVNGYSHESAVDAGDYIAQATALDNQNYTLEQGENLLAEYTIEKLDITGRTDLQIVLGDSLTYNGEVQTQDISSIKIGDLDITCQIFNYSGVNAGTYTLKIVGTGNFTGEAEQNFTILQAENAPHMPDKALDAAIKNGRKVSDISLEKYTGWIWSTEDADTILPTTENESIIVTVYYQGEDKENYKNTSQQILITMIECVHPEDQIDFFTDYEPTCTKIGVGHRSCKVCDMVIEENIEIAALKHSYGAPEFIWAEDYSSAEAVFTCERQECAEEENEHKKVLEAEVTVEIDGNITVYTAEVVYNGKLYTDKKQVISKKEETRLQISEGIANIPESLKAAGYTTEEKIIEACIKMVLGYAGYQEDQKVMYDIVLQVSFDGGKTWETATEENFPKEGILVAIPYPEGTNAKEYDFMVTHMFSHAMNGFQAGDIEMPEVEKTEEGLRFVVKGLSPIMIAWKSLNSGEESTKKPDEEASTTPNEETTEISSDKISTIPSDKTDKKPEAPATKDSKEEIWLLLLALSAAELAAVCYSVKKKAKQ